jgi:hypothetical protein
MSDDSSSRAEDTTFDIPSRPERRYPATGGVEYEGTTVFSVEPETTRTDDDVEDTLLSVLDGERYVTGDFFDLPAPAYLVRDEFVGTSFRAVVRDGHVELHVLPHTDANALERLYERIVAETGVDWRVECHSEPAPDRE